MNVVLVILAAGNSRRFGGNKLLHLFHGKPMYRHVIDQLQLLPADFFQQQIVVTQYEQIERELAQEGYLVVNNPESDRGISSSIQLAIEAVEDPQAALCFAVADQPYLTAATIRSLIEGYRQSQKGIGCLSNLGEMGNPAIFAAVYRPELMGLSGDTGGRKIIRCHLGDLYLHEVADGMELLDIDSRTKLMGKPKPQDGSSQQKDRRDEFDTN